MELNINVTITEEQEEIVYQHVLNIYSCNNGNTVQDIEQGIESIQHDYDFGIVSGGCLLVYNNDIKEFLKNELNINYIDDVQAFDIYARICNEVIYDRIIDVDFYILGVSTGTIYVDTYLIQNEYGDVQYSINEYVQEHKNDFRIYTLEEVEEEEEEEEEGTQFYGINGGEYYIDNIVILQEI